MISPFGATMRDLLAKSHIDALEAACEILADEYAADIRSLERGDPSEETSMAGYLPRKYILRYDLAFAELFKAAFGSVVNKLWAKECYVLDSTAEELALDSIVREAEVWLEEHGKHAKLDGFYDSVFWDTDFEYLFDPKMDGIETDEEIAKQMNLVNLEFDRWFVPFDSSRTMRPRHRLE